MARIWAQVVRSDKCRGWSHSLTLTLDPDTRLAPAPASLASGGHTSLSLHDVQLTQFPRDLWAPVTEPVVVFSLDLAAREGPIPVTERIVSRVTSSHEDEASCDAVMMWWDCWADPQQTILLSCAPRWASHHPADQELPWRDHWMQAIYYPKSGKYMHTITIYLCLLVQISDDSSEG